MTENVNICVRDVVRVRVKQRRMSCVVNLWKEGKYAVNNIPRATGIKAAIEDSKRCNIVAMEMMLKTVC